MAFYLYADIKDLYLLHLQKRVTKRTKVSVRGTGASRCVPVIKKIFK